MRPLQRDTSQGVKSHESGQAHDLDAVGFEHRLHRAFERLPVVAVFATSTTAVAPLGLRAAGARQPAGD
jgi:hypothetical protein